MFSMEEDEVEDENMGIEATPESRPEENYSYSESTESRKTVARTRKKASVSSAKGSGNNKSAKRAKEAPKKKA